MLTKSLVNNINLMTDKTIHNTIIIGSGPAGLLQLSMLEEQI